MSYIVYKLGKNRFTIVKTSAKLGSRKRLLLRDVDKATAQKAILAEGRPTPAR